MEQLSIVDHTEWWIVWEHPYGEHGIHAKHHDEEVARWDLDRLRTITAAKESAGFSGAPTYEVQEITVHRTAKKLDW